MFRENKSKTLIEEATKLIKNGTKIAVLVVDEYDDYEKNPEDIEINVDARQEELLTWAVREELQICIISTWSTRKGLLKIVDEYSNVRYFEKADANGFGDGCSRIPENADTGLDAALKEKGITHTIIMGFHVHCCVEVTAGIHRDFDGYGKGALHRGYVVLTAGDILKSSLTHPAKDRCNWKNKEGVIYFDIAGCRLKQFNEAYDSHNNSSFFTNSTGEVKDVLKNDETKNEAEVQKCIVKNSDSKSLTI